MAYAVSKSSQLQVRESIIDDENGMAETEATCLPGSAAVASSPIAKEIIDKIKKAYEHCKPAGSNRSHNSSMTNHGRFTTTSVGGNAFSDGSSMAFMLDELCHAVRGGRLASPIRDWIDELVQHEFENSYVGDFIEEEDDPEDDVKILGQKGTKGMEEHDQMIPTSRQDLALLDGTSQNKMAPPGELRFNIAGAESLVYVKILPLISSYNRTEREVLPVQLSPMFRLMSTLSDVRFGGKGLSEIDAMLECPLLLPTSDSSGMEFEDLSSSKQWVVTSSYFFATCWVRQLINSFIYAANDDDYGAAAAVSSQVGSFTSSSQGFNCNEVQKKIVERLRSLVELEEDLRFTSSKCFVFAPPGKEVFLIR